MIFYLGTHKPNWLNRFEIPMFVSRRVFENRKKFPRALCGWVLDSGGFTELSMNGNWCITPSDYMNTVKIIMSEVGNMNWAAQQDWMCEPSVLKKTGKTIEQHQKLTVQNYIDLMSIDDSVPIAPVIQGWETDDYMRHVDMYLNQGIDLRNNKIVGVGSVCRRKSLGSVIYVFERLEGLGIKLHAFGVKKTELPFIKNFINSSDSMAWSYTARYRPPMKGHKHNTCANCPEFAIKWSQEVINLINGPTQLDLEFWR